MSDTIQAIVFVATTGWLLIETVLVRRRRQTLDAMIVTLENELEPAGP